MSTILPDPHNGRATPTTPVLVSDERGLRAEYRELPDEQAHMLASWSASGFFRAATGVPAGCPSWCNSKFDGDGEHFEHSNYGHGAYLPATGGEPLAVDTAPDVGTIFPAVGVGMYQCAPFGPSVSVHIVGGGGDLDAGFDMRPHEARALIARLKAAVDAIERG